MEFGAMAMSISPPRTARSAAACAAAQSVVTAEAIDRERQAVAAHMSAQLGVARAKKEVEGCAMALKSAQEELDQVEKGWHEAKEAVAASTERFEAQHAATEKVREKLSAPSGREGIDTTELHRLQHALQNTQLEERSLQEATSHAQATLTRLRTLLARAQSQAMEASSKAQIAKTEAERSAEESRKVVQQQQAVDAKMEAAKRDLDAAQAEVERATAEAAATDEAARVHLARADAARAAAAESARRLARQEGLAREANLRLKEAEGRLAACAAEVEAYHEKQQSIQAAVCEAKAREASARASVISAQQDLERAGGVYAASESELMRARDTEAAAGYARMSEATQALRSPRLASRHISPTPQSQYSPSRLVTSPMRSPRHT
eukprot:Sspe_Gene.104351::Locus_80473_Transcript_1_1_Confidence_1.000_Length_1395::g.104351::m.104351